MSGRQTNGTPLLDRTEIQRRLDNLRGGLVELESQTRDLIRLLDAVPAGRECLPRDTDGKTVDARGEGEYLSIRDLAQRLPYAEQTIRNLMTRGVFRMGEHYIKPRSRIMFRWSKVREWLEQQAASR